MADRGWNIADLATKAGVDPGTAGDFLSGKQWPKIGTQGKFERALGIQPGTLGRLARGETGASLLDGPGKLPADVTPDFVFPDRAVVIEMLEAESEDEAIKQLLWLRYQRKANATGSGYAGRTREQDAAGEENQDSGGNE